MTMFEDQGQKIIDTILKTEGKQADLKQGIDDLQQSVNKTDESGFIKLKEAMNELKKGS